MERCVLLVRGINVGGRKTVRMADLRALVETLGARDVETYVQSGNVVCAAGDGPALAGRLEKALARTAGVRVRVLARGGADLARLVEECPFAQVDDPRRLHVAFLAAVPAPGGVSRLAARAEGGEELILAGEDAYLHLPAGIGRSKLAASLERDLGVVATVRNWRTVTALARLAGG